MGENLSIEWGVAVLVLLTAMIHASWNAVVKSSGDSLLTLTLLVVSGAVVSGVAIPFVGLPAQAAWPYLGMSFVLHAFYALFLLLAYRFGDLSHVYPIARGIGPILVALLSALLANEVPSAYQTVLLLLVSLAIASLALESGWPRGERVKPVGFAIATGVLIGAYTFVDGQGVRSAGSPLSYIVWLFFLNGIPLLTASFFLRRRRIVPFLRARGGRDLIAGLLAAIGYGIVIWAMSRSAMALVASLRETSVIFGALIGAVLLGEPFGRRRVLAALLVAAGVGLLSLSS